MFFFGHVGITTGLVHAVNKKYFKNKLNYPLIGFLSLGPDIIDKPLGLLAKERFGNNTRLYGHSLVFSLCLGLGLWIYFRNRKTKKIKTSYYVLLWSAFFGHNILDEFWIKSLHMFFWPLLGYPPTRTPEIFKRWWELLQTPGVFVPELIGILILIYLYKVELKKSST